MIFFALGYYCKPLFKKNAFSLCIMIISLLIYSVGTYFWKSTPLISDIAMSDIITQILSSTPFRFLLAVSGCFGVSLLFYYMSFVVKTFYFQKFGQITLGIYVIHFTLLKLKSFVPSISYSIYSITLLTMALIFVSIVIYCLLRKNKYTSLILLGK